MIIMHIPNRPCNIIEYLSRDRLREKLIFDDDFKQFSTRAQLCKYIYVVIILEIFKHFHDVRVIELSKNIKFIQNSFLKSCTSSTLYFLHCSEIILVIDDILVRRLRTLYTSEKEPFPIFYRNSYSILGSVFFLIFTIL